MLSFDMLIFWNWGQSLNQLCQKLQRCNNSFRLFKQDFKTLNVSTISKKLDDIEVNWNRVLQNDPLNCALLLICEISAGAEDHNKEAHNIFAFVQ